MSGTDAATAITRLVESALQAGHVDAVVENIRSGLCNLLRSGAVDLPAELAQCCDGHYARRLLLEDTERGYSVVAMTWGPHQGTALHDHGGLWCVEGVWRGNIEVLQFELMEQRDHRYRFEQRDTIQAGVGSAGCLIPPHEHHVIRNVTDQPAVSIHIYGGRMDSCCVFDADGTGWHRRSVKPLGFDT